MQSTPSMRLRPICLNGTLTQLLASATMAALVTICLSWD
jgi:hypothetical protein